MTDYPIIRFVADVGETEALLDLNDGAPFTVDADGFSLGAPSLEIDPLAVGAPYGEATITINLAATGGPQVVNAAISQLSREILRTRGWLLFQFDATTAPHWARIYAPHPQALNWESVYVGRETSRWEIPLEIPAEPFIRGARVDLGSVGVDNDPTSAGMTVALTNIEGDAPAPLAVLAEDDGGRDFKAPLVSACTVDAEGWAPLWSVDFNFSGVPWTSNGSYVNGGYYAVDFGGTITVTPPVAGRYKALLRAGFSDVDTVFDLNLNNSGRVRVTQRALGSDASEPWMWWGANGSQGWIDMGVVELGGGWHPVLNPSLTTELDLSVKVRDGNGKVRLDVMLFVPVDADDNRIEARTVKTDPVIVTDGAKRWYFDAEQRELAMAYHASGQWNAGIIPGLAGRFPQVIPGRVNTLHLVRNVNTGEDTKGDTTTVTLSYFPRWIYPMGMEA